MAFVSSRYRWITALVMAALVLPFVGTNSTDTQEFSGNINSTQTFPPDNDVLQNNLTQQQSNTTIASFLFSVNASIQTNVGRLLPVDPVLNVSIHEKPWYNHTILFDETLIESWIACLSDDQSSSCATSTEYIYGTNYVHQANLTSQTTDNNTGEIFFCRLEDPRYIQGNGDILCTRDLTPCNDTFNITACLVSTIQNSAQLYWDVNQDITVEFKSHYVNVSCGNQCFQDSPTTPPSATTEAKAVDGSGKDNTYIWIIVVVVLGVLLIALVVIIVVVIFKRRRDSKKGSKTLEDGGSNPNDVRSSVLFQREEDPSDELRVPENDAISGIAYANIELSEVSKRQSAVSSSSSTGKRNEYSTTGSHRASNVVSSNSDKGNAISEAGDKDKRNGVKTEDVKKSSTINDAQKEKPAGGAPGSDNVDTNTNSYSPLGKSQQRERNLYDSLQKSRDGDLHTENIREYPSHNTNDDSRGHRQSDTQGDDLNVNGQMNDRPTRHVRNYSDQDETDRAYSNSKRTIQQ